MVMKRALGFTLIELMIVVAIVAILVAIAYPAYTDQVTRTRRAEGKAAATQMAANLERCFTIGNAYNGAECAGAATAGTSENGYYAISAATTANTYTVSAAPQGAQATHDTKCGTLSVSSTGVKLPTADGCW